MNTITRNEAEVSVHGVGARAFGVVRADDGRILNQRIKTFAKEYTEHGQKQRISAELRFDDSCNNGHETFAITADGHSYDRGAWRESFGGCCHEEIARHFPELAPLIKWHLVSTDGPMHYTGNVVYMAGERDCWGLLKGEFRQHTSRGPNQNGGIPGVPNWTLELPDRTARDVYAMEKPAPVMLEWKACGRTGEGKARELDHARSSAVWPDATDAELMQEPAALKAALLARLPALMAEFKAAMLGAGFVYPEPRE